MRLKTKRIDQGMTLERMADKLEVSLLTYRAWELEPRKVTIENAKKICTILNCNLEDIEEWKR